MFRLTQREIHLACHLLRTLIFQPLAPLVGRRFEVTRVGDLMLAEDQLSLVNLEGRLKNEAADIELTLAKYEFADLRFEITRAPDDLSVAGAKVLATLIGGSRDTDAEGAAASDTDSDQDRATRVGYMEDLCEEIATGEIELAVRCESERKPLPLAERMRATNGLEVIPADFFPRPFVVSDAYLTNAPTVSVFRNFYL